VSLPGVAEDVAARMIERGHAVCPYSHLARHGVAVETVQV
jgi:lipoyl-dependent peroxiredoxin